MFWTAFIWGVGVSCGAAFGLILFFVLFWSLQWIVGRGAAFQEQHEETLKALVRRNEIGEDMEVQLQKISTYAAIIAHQSCDDQEGE